LKGRGIGEEEGGGVILCGYRRNVDETFKFNGRFDMQAGVTPGFEKSRGNLKERFIQLLFEEKFEADTYFVLLKHYQNVNYRY